VFTCITFDDAMRLELVFAKTLQDFHTDALRDDIYNASDTKNPQLSGL
jgi:hypothetical protein